MLADGFEIKHPPEQMLSCLAYEGDYALLDYGRLRRLRQAGAIALIAILLIGGIVLGKNIAKNISVVSLSGRLRSPRTFIICRQNFVVWIGVPSNTSR